MFFPGVCFRDLAAYLVFYVIGRQDFLRLRIAFV